MHLFVEFVPAALLVSLVLTLSQICFGQNNKKLISYDYKESESHQYGDYDSYDYGTNKPVKISCYSCTYMIEDGEMQGMENCNVPFVSFGIPEVMCEGSCGATYRILDKDEKGKNTNYMIVRDCRPNCKEEDLPYKYTKCCKTNKCNHFMSSSHPLENSRVLSLLTFNLIFVLKHIL